MPSERVIVRAEIEPNLSPFELYRLLSRNSGGATATGAGAKSARLSFGTARTSCASDATWATVAGGSPRRVDTDLAAYCDLVYLERDLPNRTAGSPGPALATAAS
jgi:hypothetical protein